MDRLISEQAVLDVINEAIRIGRFYCGKERTIEEIKAIPSAESKYCDRNICLRNEYNGIGCDECEVTKSQEPKTGHWIERIDHEENCRTLICSNCGRPALHDGDSIWKHKFCPHCGARMIEPQESEVNNG